MFVEGEEAVDGVVSQSDQAGAEQRGRRRPGFVERFEDATAEPSAAARQDVAVALGASSRATLRRVEWRDRLRMVDAPEIDFRAGRG